MATISLKGDETNVLRDIFLFEAIYSKHHVTALLFAENLRRKGMSSEAISNAIRFVRRMGKDWSPLSSLRVLILWFVVPFPCHARYCVLLSEVFVRFDSSVVHVSILQIWCCHLEDCSPCHIMVRSEEWQDLLERFDVCSRLVVFMSIVVLRIYVSGPPREASLVLLESMAYGIMGRLPWLVGLIRQERFWVGLLSRRCIDV